MWPPTPLLNFLFSVLSSLSLSLSGLLSNPLFSMSLASGLSRIVAAVYLQCCHKSLATPITALLVTGTGNPTLQPPIPITLLFHQWRLGNPSPSASRGGAQGEEAQSRKRAPVDLRSILPWLLLGWRSKPLNDIEGCSNP